MNEVSELKNEVSELKNEEIFIFYLRKLYQPATMQLL